MGLDSETSCLTLGDVLMLKAGCPKDAEQIARLSSAVGGKGSGFV